MKTKEYTDGYIDGLEAAIEAILERVAQHRKYDLDAHDVVGILKDLVLEQEDLRSIK